MAQEVKDENEFFKKVRDKNDRKYIKRIQDRRCEFQFQNEASRHKALLAQHERN